MIHWQDEPRNRYDALTLRILWVTIALSCLVHLSALVLWQERPVFRGPGVDAEDARPSDRLRVRLAAISKAEPAPAPPQGSVAPAKPQVRPLKTPLRTHPLPTLTLPAPAAPTIAAPAQPAPAIPPVAAPSRPNPPVVEGDLWSYVQARRRERGEQQMPATEKPSSESNAALAANLPSAAPGIAAQDKRRGGGIFEIKRMNYDDAAFEFFGWNNEMGRNTPQLIEVRKGDNSDMRIAVVRRMIAIIRMYSQSDFVWRSPHYENGLVLSARPSDNAALENFLMRDFFNDSRQLP
jgi:hypothetical protein